MELLHGFEGELAALGGALLWAVASLVYSRVGRHIPALEMNLLKDIQGLPLEEISGMLDLPLGTVKSRSSRARIELAKAITEITGPDGSMGAEAAT